MPSESRSNLADSADRVTPNNWQSIEQWMDTPEFQQFLENEFPEDAAEWTDPVSRRRFLTLMGASLALAGAAGCNPSLRPASPQKVVPYVQQPDQILAGVPLYFATAMAQAGGVGLGLLARSNMGRPTKIEGNPSHSCSQGSANILALASILDLYDPDRSKQVLHNGAPTTTQKARNIIRDTLNKQREKQGAGIRIVTDPSTSPTVARLMGEFLKVYPQAKWIQYEPLAQHNITKANKAAFGKHVSMIAQFDKAMVVLALDCDFLAASTPADVRYSRDFISKRKVRRTKPGLDAKDGISLDGMSRLYAVESMLTNTGATADHRLPLKPSQIEGFTRALAAKFGVAGVTDPSDLPEEARKFVDALHADLSQNQGKAVVVAGEAQPPLVHLLALAINEKLGSFGTTLKVVESISQRPSDAGSIAELKQLTEELDAGTIELLILDGVNPAYDAPIDLQFKQKLIKSGGKTLRVHRGLYLDETAVNCDLHFADTHFLESWGDLRGHDGTVLLQQPLIAPLYEGESRVTFLAYLTDQQSASAPLEVIQATWRTHFQEKGNSGSFDLWWQKAVRNGLIEGTESADVSAPKVNLAILSDAEFAPRTYAGIELQYRPDPTLYDGRYANNGWLQEMPKPITKLCWDNAAIVSPATAEKLGCAISFRFTGGENGRAQADVVELAVGEAKIKAAVFILPGHADDCISIYLGHGRERAGRTGSPEGIGTGFDSYRLRTSANLWIAGDVAVTKTNEEFLLAFVQGQYAMEGRRPVRHATREQFEKHPIFAQIPAASPAEFHEIRALTPGTPEDFHRLGLHHPLAKDSEDHHEPHDKRIIPLSLYPKYPQVVNGEEANVSYRRWGMAIDLSACTGCSACVIACVSENNTPVVGKEQVTRGRSMHWLRIDRYYSIPGEEIYEDHLGDRTVRGAKRYEQVKKSSEIRTHFQPVMCTHCEKAPCEVVCPVGATVHSADGLNDMVYNRCVGTRYCSNNCPYKVRRFNFLQYSDYSTSTLKLVNNPEVTVRTRGVMEKCTYCVQRIRLAEIEAEREWKTRLADKSTTDVHGRPKIKDGDIITACQAACPTQAIMFGDINDPESGVLRWKMEPHTYGLLAELNTMPRTSYLASIRNPNPALTGTTKGGH